MSVREGGLYLMKNYNLCDAHAAEKYVLKRYSHLKNSSIHVYQSITFLEEIHNGFCNELVTTYREIEKWAYVGKDTLKAALAELAENGLLRVSFGSQIKDDDKATTIQRISIDDIQRASCNGEQTAHKLAHILNERPLIINGRAVQPIWSVLRTGRVSASKPAVQNMSSLDRKNGLMKGLSAGMSLIYADIKSADPTVIKHILKTNQSTDLYRIYSDATGECRSVAKKKINTLAYCKNSEKVFYHWPDAAKANEELRKYVEDLHRCKSDVFAESKKSRSVRTLTGRLITAEKGIRLHAGMVFNWKIQGTVADIINTSALDLFTDQAVTSIMPVHDALYVVMQSTAPEKTQMVERCIYDNAKTKVGFQPRLEQEIIQGEDTSRELRW